MRKPLTLSIIIPAYNEEDHLPGCLDAIAKQTHKPFEVIVVDNNSIDKTSEIAKSYDFVTLLHEEKQGLIPARNKGLAAAKGSLLARVDADSILNETWVARVLDHFASENLVALTGPGKMFIDAHLPMIQSTLWTKLYNLHTISAFRFPVLWGANMVITRSLWQQIKAEACLCDADVHEDQDLSIIIRSKGHVVAYDNELCISTDGKRFMYLPKTLEYYARERRTLRRHKQMGTLSLARRGSTNPLLAGAIFVIILPLNALFGLLAGLYTLEVKLGFRKNP